MKFRQAIAMTIGIAVPEGIETVIVRITSEDIASKQHVETEYILPLDLADYLRERLAVAIPVARTGAKPEGGMH